MNQNLIEYYSNRAEEYEQIYSRPERQNDLNQVTNFLQQAFKNKEVFEIACGTGYWTERLAVSARKILATDINGTVLEIAKSKSYPSAEVNLAIADIFDLKDEFKYESLFGGFIWSHIKLEELNNFLKIISDKVITGGTIVFMDNNYVEGSNLPVSYTDEHGNTYQDRQLENGSTYNVLKNFPDKDFIMEKLRNKSMHTDIIKLQYYWILIYKNL